MYNKYLHLEPLVHLVWFLLGLLLDLLLLVQLVFLGMWLGGRSLLVLQVLLKHLQPMISKHLKLL